MRSLTAALAALVLLAAPAAGQSAPPARSIDSACPDGRIPEDGFDDAGGSVHENAVDCVVWWGVARGLDSRRYAPGRVVTRAAMATFVANLVAASAGTLPAGPDAFGDDDGSPHEDNINRLAEAGIVTGTADGRFSPGRAVTRAQMATFLVAAYEHRTGGDLRTDADYFRDDDGDVHEPNINAAAEVGWTAGDGDGYAPLRSVERGAMASFVARVLDLLVDEGWVPTRFNPDPLRLQAPTSQPAHVLRFYDAADPPTRQRGLMGIRELPDDAGMLFRFPQDTSGGFWMKNTIIPLSIAFADSGGRIVAIRDMEPCQADPCPVYSPGVPYRFALEVDKGRLDDLGVVEGWTFELPEGLPAPS